MDTAILIIFIVLIIASRNKKIKGYLGERSVSKKINKLEDCKYKSINNLMLKTAKGTTQIDHVVISIYGIFVIETKNYKGWIIGHEYDEYWKQVIYKRKERLRNPIKQNYGHIMALKEALSNHKDIDYISIVAFSPRAQLKVNVTSNVIYLNKINKVIKSYRQECLTTYEVDNIFNELNELNIDSRKMRKKHVKNVKENIKYKKKLEALNLCPRCGEALVMRNGKNGRFYGCSSFPKCRYTRELY